ncbi:hypothetical protein L1049_003013 [Liquidambar formosana]|uniref:Uncharacterized protein n=1 Tax=Liquidambar formosana TaxID=63359 RepID=A0AAP0R765_LIQFO
MHQGGVRQQMKEREKEAEEKRGYWNCPFTPSAPLSPAIRVLALRGRQSSIANREDNAKLDCRAKVVKFLGTISYRLRKEEKEKEQHRCSRKIDGDMGRRCRGEVAVAAVVMY